MPKPPFELPDHLARLLSSSIETVERFDVLLVLRRSAPKSWSARAVAAELSIGNARAESALAMLCGRGFLTVTIGTDHFYAYAPVSASIDAALGEIVAHAERDRNRVLAALSDKRTRDSAHAFANAFLLRKKDGEGG